MIPSSHLPFPLLLAGLAAAAAPSSSNSLETVTILLPTEGTAFNTTIPACGGTVPPFVVAGAPEASFNPGTHPVYLPPQAPLIATSFIKEVEGQNATEVIIATPLPGSCGPLYIPAAVTHHSNSGHASPSSTGDSSPVSTGNSSSAPYLNTTASPSFLTPTPITFPTPHNNVSSLSFFTNATSFPIPTISPEGNSTVSPSPNHTHSSSTIPPVVPTINPEGPGPVTNNTASPSPHHANSTSSPIPPTLPTPSPEPSGTEGISPHPTHSPSAWPTPPAPVPSSNGTSNGTTRPWPHTNSSIPSSQLCPIGTCTEALLSASALRIKYFLNELSIATESLESVVAVGLAPSSSTRRLRREEEVANARFSILTSLVLPLESIATTLTSHLPLLSAHSIFPRGCDSDTITHAAEEFVDAQRGLFQILLVRAEGFLGGFHSAEDDELVAGGDDAVANQDFHVPVIGALIRGALELIEKGVDELVADLIAILPARAECLRKEVAAIDGVLEEVIAAFA